MWLSHIAMTLLGLHCKGPTAWVNILIREKWWGSVWTFVCVRDISMFMLFIYIYILCSWIQREIRIPVCVCVCACVFWLIYGLDYTEDPRVETGGEQACQVSLTEVPPLSRAQVSPVRSSPSSWRGALAVAGTGSSHHHKTCWACRHGRKSKVSKKSRFFFVHAPNRLMPVVSI